MKKVIKYILAIAMIFAIMLTLVGCNKQVVDLKYNFNKAIIKLPDGTVIQGEVRSWRDYEDGDQIQVNIEGVTYLVHSANCVLYD